MRFISKSTLREYWEQPRNLDAEKELINWHKVITEGIWNKPNEITETAYLLRSSRAGAFLVGSRTFW